ncbi:MAG: hydrolase, partial [Bradyrhizobium sp.]|nr:hydrolase [Bradyrhizobium sp.]
MNLSRRTILKAASVLPLAAGSLDWRAFAQNAPATAPAAEIPPMLFVHGNGDQAPIWMTTFWRMESNGILRDRLFAINFTDPLARTDDTVAQPQHSSTED